MENLPKDVEEKYDRQIRLFGVDVQKKILNTHVIVLQGDAFGENKPSDEFVNEHYPVVSGEIVKNFVLLGCANIYLNDGALKSFRKIVPHDIEKINEHARITIITAEDLNTIEKEGQIVALVDQPSGFMGDNVYFVCSNCYSFHSAFETHNACARNTGKETVSHECMIGSLFVHEMVKMLRNEEYHKNFKLEM